MTDLDALLDEWLREEIEESPVTASGLGIDGYDDQLGDLSAAAFERRDRRAEHWQRTLEAVPDDGLSVDQAIDRDLVLSALRGREVMRDWEAWRRDPSVYLGPCLSGVFVLFLHRLHPEPELARSAATRLRGVPQVLGDARANLDAARANRLIVERAVGQCRAAVGYARSMVPTEVHDPALRADLAAAGEIAAAAFETFLPFLEELAAAAAGPYAIGEERYSGLLRHKELLGYGAVEMRERGRAAWAALDIEMAELAEQVDGSRDWRAVMERVNTEHPRTPEEMRAQYEDWTERARQFLVDRKLVTLPEGERCLVEPSPPFQRPVLAVASYNAPPAFKPSLVGHFFVPYPPEGTSQDEVQQRLADNSTQGVPTTAVHEAYPGHHWHLTWMQQNPRPLRQAVRTPYFTEGWALYAERMMREQGFFTDPRQELCHLDARIFRAARIVVDTSLHIGDMTVDEAVDFMSTKATLTEPTARAEVGRYCAWPTQASSYLTGSLEIERIRERFFAEGRGDLRTFHDAIAGSGGLPIALAERAVLA
ncbi:MAG: hypothetical protein QOG87_3388 [Actinomycetota bacterium]|jgi:uncharacterized protein (DUF885 family)